MSSKIKKYDYHSAYVTLDGKTYRILKDQAESNYRRITDHIRMILKSYVEETTTPKESKELEVV